MTALRPMHVARREREIEREFQFIKCYLSILGASSQKLSQCLEFSSKNLPFTAVKPLLKLFGISSCTHFLSVFSLDFSRDPLLHICTQPASGNHDSECLSTNTIYLFRVMQHCIFANASFLVFLHLQLMHLANICLLRNMDTLNQDTQSRYWTPYWYHLWQTDTWFAHHIMYQFSSNIVQYIQYVNVQTVMTYHASNHMQCS